MSKNKVFTVLVEKIESRVINWFFSKNVQNTVKIGCDENGFLAFNSIVTWKILSLFFWMMKVVDGDVSISV